MQWQSQMTLAHASTINARTHAHGLPPVCPVSAIRKLFPLLLVLFLFALARDGSERYTRASPPTRAPGRN